MQRGQSGVIPVHLLRELDQVPAVRRGRPADRRRDDRERQEQEGRVPAPAGQEIEWTAPTRARGRVRMRRDRQRRDEHAGERVERGPLRRDAEAEKGAGDQDVGSRGEAGAVRGHDEVPAGHDEERDVHVVHADAGLREHRPVEQDGEADEDRNDA